MEQEAADPDRDEVQDEEIVPEQAVFLAAAGEERNACDRGEDEPAIRDRVQRLRPEGRVPTAFAIGKIVLRPVPPWSRSSNSFNLSRSHLTSAASA